MKKLAGVIFGLLIAIGCMAQTADGYTLSTVSAADTIIITNADLINNISISVPSDATDSTEVFGLAKTFNSGAVSQVVDGVIIAPGEEISVNGAGPIKYLYIIVRDKARLISKYATKAR